MNYYATTLEIRVGNWVLDYETTFNLSERDRFNNR